MRLGLRIKPGEVIVAGPPCSLFIFLSSSTTTTGRLKAVDDVDSSEDPSQAVGEPGVPIRSAFELHRPEQDYFPAAHVSAKGAVRD